MDPILRREIILDHYQNPHGHGLVDEDGYIKINTNNESCIDNLDIMYKIVDDVIQDIRFDGDACAISTSATSIMISSLIGKTRKEAALILEEYEKMLNEENYDSEVLGELNVYEDIYKQPNRKKCALLPFESLRRILK
ncbi:MAG: SUF system NifU family Fe-S cluster assembly protein [bacterium]|nr:SUF system NifU family Fe-S cluster assembly protein [bacterium]